MNNKVLIIISVVLLVLLDQLIKWLMFLFWTDLIVKNKAVIFGWVDNSDIGYGLLAIGSGILIWLIKRTNFNIINYRLSIIFISAGACSNLIDRIFRGFVVDYFNFYHLNNFNLADIFIVLGAVLYLYQSLKKSDHKIIS